MYVFMRMCVYMYVRLYIRLYVFMYACRCLNLYGILKRTSHDQLQVMERMRNVYAITQV